MDGAECKARVEADMAELPKFHVNSTPSLLHQRQPRRLARIPKEAFKQMIDEKLKVAEASGVPCGDYYEKEVMGKGEKQFRSKGPAPAAPAGSAKP